MVGEHLGVIMKGESKEIVDLRKNTVLVSLIVGVDGWGRMISLKKEKALEKSQEQIKRLRQNSGIFLEQSRWQHLYLKRMHRNL